jgi:MFS family permease
VPDEPPRSPPRGHLASLLALGLLVGTVNGASRIALPLYVTALGGAAWQVGMAGGLGYTGLLLMALPMSAVIEQHGNRKPFVFGVLLAALLYGVLAAATQPGWAMLTIALLGLALPLRLVPTFAEFMALLPRLPPLQAGWNRAASTMGMFFLGPALAAAAIAAMGYGWTFVLLSAGLLASAALAPAGLRDARLHADGPPADSGEAPTTAAGLRASIARQWQVFRSRPDLQRAVGIDFVTQLAVAYFVVFALVLAVQRFGFSTQRAASLVTLQGALYVATLFFGGHLFERWGEEARYLLAFSLLLLQAALLGWGSHAHALWLGSALLGLGLGVQSLANVARVARLMQQFGRGAVSGLASIGPPAGGVLGAMGGGLVAQAWGSAAGFKLLALGFALLCAGQAWRLRRAPTPAAR